MTTDSDSGAVDLRLRLADLDGATRGPAIALARSIWDRPTSGEYLRWRYEQCPTQTAALALAGDECVATLYALRRQYLTPGGLRECLEPFEWHTSDRWRATGAGLRVVKRLMAGSRPMLALGGTAAATKLFARLGWTELCVGGRFVLPLRGAFLRARGRSVLTAGVFDLIVRHHFTPSAKREPAVTLSAVSEVDPEVVKLVSAQTRFAWIRIPDGAMVDWLGRAPAEIGRYGLYDVRIDGQLAGWVTTRIHFSGGVRKGEMQEIFLHDEHRARYPEVVRATCRILVGQGVDMIGCVTTCPDTTSALRLLKFRHDDEERVFAWAGGQPVSKGPALFDGGHADRLFFPVPTAAESARISADASRRTG